MKKISTLIIIIMGLLFISHNITKAGELADSLRGKILLQVESNGEAWYVKPSDSKKIYLKDGDVAYNVMRDLGLGISNSDLFKIPIGFEDRFECVDSDGDSLCDKLEEGMGTNPYSNDSDGDGYDDGMEIRNNYNPLGAGILTYDSNLADTLKGKILLQVESRGEAWYINPDNSKRYYMTDGEAAYQIMRYLSLGITNTDLDKIVTEESIEYDTETQDDTENACTENWSCNDWNECLAGQQNRSCTDYNTCGTTLTKPLEQQSCLEENYPLNFESEIEVSSITSSTASITWKTNQFSTAIVQYGTSPLIFDLSETMPGTMDDYESINLWSHEVNLENLTPNTMYYFKVISDNTELESETDSLEYCGCSITSLEQIFTTLIN